MSGSSPQGHISRLRPRHPPLAVASSLFRNVTASCVCSPWCPHHTAGRSSTGTRHYCARSGFSTLRTRVTPAPHDGVSPTRPRHASECSPSSSNSTVRLVRRRTRTVGLHGLDCGGHVSALTRRVRWKRHRWGGSLEADGAARAIAGRRSLQRKQEQRRSAFRPLAPSSSAGVPGCRASASV